MKKLILLFAAFVLTITLVACNRDPGDIDACLNDPTLPECQTACPEGQELVGTDCLAVCPDGEHREGVDCVVDTITCPDGQHEENGTCVLDDNRTPEEIAVDLLVSNFDGDMTFLSNAMMEMHFENAMTLTTEFDFEITEDIDEVHYIDATIVDRFVYDETNGDMVKRSISFDVDGEVTVAFEMILHEVPTGVHVYIEADPIITLLADGNQEAINILNWVGLDDQWAHVKLDDSLQNVIELRVLKDMVVALFFSEMGDTFFTDVQENMIEPEIGFDLSPYGVDLGQLVDYLIEEDFASFEADLLAIDEDGIILHIDAMYVAPHLYEIFMEYSTELTAASFDITKLEMLNVATYNETTEMFEPLLPIDPLEGSEAFFAALTETELQTLKDVAIEPFIEMMLYEQLSKEVNPDWLQNDLDAILNMYGTYLEDMWPEESDPFVLADELADLAMYGPVEYWNQLSESEQWAIHAAIDHHYRGWVVWEFEEALEREWDYEYWLRKYPMEMDLDYITNTFKDFIGIPDNVTEFNTTHGVDVTSWSTEIDNVGIVEFYRSLSWETTEAILQVQGLVGNESYSDTVHDLQMIYDDYGLQWYYDWNGQSWSPEWFENDLIWEIEMYATYLADNFGLNAADLKTAIETEGVLDWYMNTATPTVKEALHAIADMNGPYGHITWILQNLDDYMMYGNEFHIWFGRGEELNPLYELDANLEILLADIAYYIDPNTAYTAGDWVLEVQSVGALSWWDNLDQAAKDAIDDAIEDMGYHHNDWVIWKLHDRDESPWMYDVCWGNWGHCHNVDDLTMMLDELVEEYEFDMMDMYGEDPVALASAISMYGAVDFYMYHATENQREMFRDLAERDYWEYEVMWKIEGINDMEYDILDFLYTHQTQLDTLGFDATGKITYIETNGIVDFVLNDLTEADLAILLDEYVYPRLEGLHTAFVDDEVIEFLVAEIFGNIHMDELLTEIGPNPIFDETIIQARMMAIDFDALSIELETFDFEALAYEIRDGQTAYDTYLTNLTGFPNMVSFLQILSPGISSLEEYMIYVDDLEYAIENLTLFEQFITIEYYMDNIVEAVPERTEDGEFLLDFELDGLGMGRIFDDLTEQAGIFLAGFTTIPFPYDDEWNCLVAECEPPEFDEVIAELATMGAITGHLVYDPHDLTWMELGLDATDFLDEIVEKEYADKSSDPEYVPSEYNDDWTGVNNFSVTITMENTSTITLPDAADIDDVNMVVEDFAKFNMTKEAYDILMEYAEEFNLDPSAIAMELYNNPVALEDIENMEFSAAFDLEMSTIEIVVPMLYNPITMQNDIPDLTGIDYHVELYWIDGTLVHDAPVGLNAMLPYWLNGDLQSKAAYDDMVDMINDTNWHMMKLFAYYMLMDAEFEPDMN